MLTSLLEWIGIGARRYFRGEVGTEGEAVEASLSSVDGTRTRLPKQKASSVEEGYSTRQKEAGDAASWSSSVSEYDCFWMGSNSSVCGCSHC